MFAAIDSSLFTAGVTFVLGGGVVGAYTAYRKTPVEVESISVATLRGTVETLQAELARREREIAELRERIVVLEGRS